MPILSSAAPNYPKMALTCRVFGKNFFCWPVLFVHLSLTKFDQIMLFLKESQSERHTVLVAAIGNEWTLNNFSQFF